MSEQAVFSEIYQASLRPHPPDKPLPDETGFMEYPLSPPRNPPGFYMPLYYPPPLPPAPIPAPSAPAPAPYPGPYSTIPTVRHDRVRATTGQTSSDRDWSLATCISYAALVMVGLLLFTLAVLLAVVMAGRRFSVKRHTTPEDEKPVALRTAPHNYVGIMPSSSIAIESGRPNQQVPSVTSMPARRRRVG